MNHIFIPTQNADDWQKLLADPEKQWRTGFSAKTLATCWETAGGFPPEVALLFSQSGIPAFHQIQLLLAFPEYQVAMPPSRGHPSQNDLFVLAKADDDHLIAITIEGKVSEPFGEKLDKWSAKASHGKKERLSFIQNRLGLSGDLPKHIRYQLLHRTASAIIEAKCFNAPYAAMIVHSFNQSDLWFDDYQNFLALFDVPSSEPGKLFFLKETHGVKIYSGWARGNEKFLLA
jgi:hypothetical protein